MTKCVLYIVQPHPHPPTPQLSLYFCDNGGRRACVEKEARSAELREKFETAVPSIQEKLKLEAERRQQQRLDNEELRGKLVSFAEQAKLRCARASRAAVGFGKGGAGGGGICCYVPVVFLVFRALLRRRFLI